MFSVLAGSGHRLDPNLWQQRLDETTAKCEKVKEAVDKCFAHNDRSQPEGRLQWNDANDAIDAVVSLYWWLKCLIERIGSESLIRQTPQEFRDQRAQVLESTHWDDIFCIPWIPPRQE